MKYKKKEEKQEKISEKRILLTAKTLFCSSTFQDEFNYILFCKFEVKTFLSFDDKNPDFDERKFSLKTLKHKILSKNVPSLKKIPAFLM